MQWPTNFPIAFSSPYWLLLLLVLPFVVRLSIGSLAGLGGTRQAVAITLRCLVLLLVVAAISDMQWVRTTDNFCTFFVLDVSQSIPNTNDVKSGETGGGATAERALKLVSDAVTGRGRANDQAGLIVFGKEARIELPPAQYPKQNFAIRSIGSSIDRQHSNIAAGLKLALGSFPPETAKRIVLISDGNQNLGNALAQALAAQKNADGRIPIDVVPIEYRYDSEILVDKVILPPDLKKGDVANLKIAIRSARPAGGNLRLYRNDDSGRRLVFEDHIQLEEGLTVVPIKQKIDGTGTFTYEADFEPDPNSGDRLARNNQRTGFTMIRGKGKVLLLEPSEGAFADLAAALGRENIEVVSRSPERLRESLSELRSFDAVIVANVPAERLTESMQKLLVSNCRDLGAGLMMIGGKDSFGAGGYRNSPMEEALPVDMEIKSTKIRGKGALVMVMHACEIPEGNFWEKEVATLALDKLGPEDECGILEFGGTKMQWVFDLQKVGDGKALKRLVGRMAPSDMPDFDPGMQMALASLNRSDAMTKHCIIISDGDPQDPSDATLRAFQKAKITVSTVAIATHGGFERAKMGRIAKATKGRFYEVTNAKALPQIYIQETRVVSRPLLFERDPPWSPKFRTITEPVNGLTGNLPPIRGLVLTQAKPTADVPIISPIPAELELVPLVAHWQYNLGRAVAVTTDAGQLWATGWPKTQQYQKFWAQLVRWMLRPAENENLSLTMQEKDGEVTVVVNAIDKQNEFLNFLRLKGKLIQPLDSEGKMPVGDVEFRQTEPGKYEAKFKAGSPGSYFLSIAGTGADGKATMLSTGLDVSYPPEFRDLESNRDLMENIARVTDGRVIPFDQAAQTDFFLRERGPTNRLSDAWPFLLLTALCLFLADVAVRRIAIEPAEVKAFANRTWRAMRRKPEVKTSETMERLKSIKQSVGEQLEKVRRFEADPNAPPPEAVATPLQQTEGPKAALPPKPVSPTLAPEAEKPAEDTPFSRLLKAKQDALKKRKEEEGKG